MYTTDPQSEVELEGGRPKGPEDILGFGHDLVLIVGSIRPPPGFVSRKPESPTPLVTYMWLQSAMNFYILAPVRVKVVALSIETLRWRTLGVCY